MTKKLLGIVLISIIFLILGCKKITDCGTDMDCFNRNYKMCKLSKVNGGLIEIRGGTPESCLIYVKSDYSQDMSLESQNLSMNCVAEDTSNSNFSMIDLVEKGFCRGSYNDYIIEIQEKEKIIDCGEDLKCFAKSFLTCKPSKMVYGGGTGALYGGSYEVKGIINGSCVVYADDTIQTSSKKGNPINKTLTMECVVPDIKAYEGDFAIIDLVEENYCKGTFNDYLSQSFMNK